MIGPTNEPPVAGTGRGHLPRSLARVMSVLPLVPLEFAANRILLDVLRRNPGLVARMGDYAAKRFAIDPTDCPFAFIMELRPERPRLGVVSSLAGAAVDARISGSILVLMGLLDGTYDGDALFFTRDLVIEGDTAAVLALRNAIEEANLDPAGIIGAPEAVAPLVTRGLREVSQRLRTWLGAPEGAPAPGQR